MICSHSTHWERSEQLHGITKQSLCTCVRACLLAHVRACGHVCTVDMCVDTCADIHAKPAPLQRRSLFQAVSRVPSSPALRICETGPHPSGATRTQPGKIPRQNATSTLCTLPARVCTTSASTTPPLALARWPATRALPRASFQPGAIRTRPIRSMARTARRRRRRQPRHQPRHQPLQVCRLPTDWHRIALKNEAATVAWPMHQVYVTACTPTANIPHTKR